MMKYEIRNSKCDDYIIVEGETIEEIVAKAMVETTYRGWKAKDCWSKEIVP